MSMLPALIMSLRKVERDIRSAQRSIDDNRPGFEREPTNVFVELSVSLIGWERSKSMADCHLDDVSLVPDSPPPINSGHVDRLTIPNHIGRLPFESLEPILPRRPPTSCSCMQSIGIYHVARRYRTSAVLDLDGSVLESEEEEVYVNRLGEGVFVYPPIDVIRRIGFMGKRAV